MFSLSHSPETGPAPGLGNEKEPKCGLWMPLLLAGSAASSGPWTRPSTGGKARWGLCVPTRGVTVEAPMHLNLQDFLLTPHSSRPPGRVRLLGCPHLLPPFPSTAPCFFPLLPLSTEPAWSQGYTPQNASCCDAFLSKEPVGTSPADRQQKCPGSPRMEWARPRQRGHMEAESHRPPSS